MLFLSASSSPLPLSVRSAYALLTTPTASSLAADLLSLPSSLLHFRPNTRVHRIPLIFPASSLRLYLRVHPHSTIHATLLSKTGVVLVHGSDSASASVTSALTNGLAAELCPPNIPAAACVERIAEAFCGAGAAAKVAVVLSRDARRAEALVRDCMYASQSPLEWIPALLYAVLFITLTACQVLVILWGAAFAISFNAVELCCILKCRVLYFAKVIRNYFARVWKIRHSHADP